MNERLGGEDFRFGLMPIPCAPYVAGDGSHEAEALEGECVNEKQIPFEERHLGGSGRGIQ